MKETIERIKYLQKLPEKDISWDSIENAIRDESKGNFIDKAKRAVEVGLWDSAMLYFWNESMKDLRKKVMTYGIEYFPNTQNTNIKKEDDLSEKINDYNLIDGCFQIGIITKEAWFFLQKCREIRNQYTSAHLSDSQIDRLEALNFIKNCVKYVLTNDPPSPGFNIRSIIERMKEKGTSNNINEIKTAILEQAEEIRKALVNRFFSEFVDVNCDAELRSNIESIAKDIWDKTDEETKNEIGQRYVKIAVGMSQESASLAFKFFKIINGIGKIPEAYRRPMFEKYAKDLLNAYHESDNFYKEGPKSKELFDMGFDVPIEAANLYTKAVLLSYLGNSFGYCWEANVSNEKMIKKFNVHCIKESIELINNDRDVQSVLLEDKTIKRLKNYLNILLQLPLIPEHELIIKKLHEMDEEKIYNIIFEKLFPKKDDIPF